MNFLLPYFLLFISICSFGQETFEDKDAKKIVDIFFEGFHKGDTLTMRSVIAANAVLQTAAKMRDGSDAIDSTDIHTLLKAIADRPSDQVWEEVLLDYKISVDGNLAHVWTPYEFYFNGNFSHCGANAFTIAKTNKGWKIINLIDSRRRASCIPSRKQ